MGQQRMDISRSPGAAAARSLPFHPPDTDEELRPTLTRQRVVAEALTLIAQEGVEALTMRTLAARLGVVPGALYRHVRSKEQLQDLVVDGVLAEVDCEINQILPWIEQVKVLAHRLRTVLEAHPGVAGLLKTRDPLAPHSLAVAEAVLLPLRNAGFPTTKPASPSSSSSTTPSDSRSATPACPSTNNVSATRRPDNDSTNSSGRFPLTASPPSPPSASTSGSTTATNDSPPASTPSSTD